MKGTFVRKELSVVKGKFKQFPEVCALQTPDLSLLNSVVLFLRILPISQVN